MKPAPNDRHLGYFVLPAMLLLSLLFVIPILRFMLEAFEGQAAKEIVAQGAAVLTEPTVMAALLTTNIISLQVTFVVLLVSYPIAYCLTRVQGGAFMFIMFCIIAPSLTSTIIRTFAIMILGGRNGVLNNILVHQTGILSTPIPFLFNRMAVVFSMAYVLLPYMVLTLYSAMRSIDDRLLQAARSLGAGEVYVFRKVFFPLTLHGAISGSLIVFIFGLGYYLTPALVGGSRDVMIAQFIQKTIETELNWAAASYMSLVLVGATLILYAFYCWFTDMRRLIGGGS